jgi:uncharacterized zinc-type alcohol dehydrogenase-like protein
MIVPWIRFFARLGRGLSDECLFLPGHMAVKFAVALGAHVTVFSTSESKRVDAYNLKANDFVSSKDAERLQSSASTFDFIIDTVSADHDVIPLINLLKKFGKYVFVGAPDKPLKFQLLPLLLKNVIVTGSIIGGIKETQEMLNFCAEHDITCDIELIGMKEINEAYDRVMKSDVKYRFVIDILNTF